MKDMQEIVRDRRHEFIIGLAAMSPGQERRSEICMMLVDMLDVVEQTSEETLMVVALRAFSDEIGRST